MMKKLWLTLLIPAAAFAQSGEQEFKLKGDLKLSRPADWVYLRYASGDRSVADSMQPKNGEFKFEGKIAEPTVATISVKFAPIAGSDKTDRDYTQLFLEPGKTELTAKDSLKFAQVKGGQGQKDFEWITQSYKPYNDRMEMLYADYETARKANDQAGMKRVEDQVDALSAEANEKVYANFIKTHPSSPVSVYALRQYAGWDIDPVKVEPLFASLPANAQQMPSAVALKDRIAIAKKTAVGSQAMDFTQKDTLGNDFSLSSLRGKYVLIDFWASWCGPCRRENPNVVKTFNKYKDRNFTVLGVSLDRPNAKDKWLKAIHDDGLTWNHVSDLKYWDNEVAKQYGIRAIPQNLLIDPQGKIIGRNLTGEKLDQKLNEVLVLGTH